MIDRKCFRTKWKAKPSTVRFRADDGSEQRLQQRNRAHACFWNQGFILKISFCWKLTARYCPAVPVWRLQSQRSYTASQTALESRGLRETWAAPVDSAEERSKTSSCTQRIVCLGLTKLGSSLREEGILSLVNGLREAERGEGKE